MLFYAIIQYIKTITTDPSVFRALECLLNKLDIDSLTADPCVQYPIQLEEVDIAFLVDLAITTNVSIPLNNKSIDLLTLLIDLGTAPFDQQTASAFDPILGKKDARIEHSIIQAAIKCQRSQSETFSSVAHAVIYGLSGNPPTKNHLLFIQHLQRYYPTVHIILNAQSPLKVANDYLDADVRFQMLHAMLHAEKINQAQCIIERLEIDRAPPSRMIATISALILKTKKPTCFTLALGMDALLSFQEWYQWQRYGKLCALKFYPHLKTVIEPAKMQRLLMPLLDAGILVSIVFNSVDKREEYARVLAPLFVKGLALRVESMKLDATSSTAVRAFYRSGHSGQAPGLTSAVADLIKKNNYYGS